MSRLRVQEAVAVRLEEAREWIVATYEHFRESRLYVQTVCAVVLVTFALLVHSLPYGPLVRANAMLVWAVKEDYDFQRQATEWGAWVRSRGGLKPAVSSLWQQGVERVRGWVGPVDLYPGQLAAPGSTTGQTGDSQDASSNTGVANPPASSLLAPVTLPPLQPVEGSVLSDYGWLPQGVSEEFHEGIDFLAKPGTVVSAVQDGQVIAIRQDLRLGTVVEIRHGDVFARYAQVTNVKVGAGDEVHRGQAIAVVAAPRGNEQKMQPHLHFEIRPVGTGEPVDPVSYLGLGGKKL